jgi:D-sedoheptulose 7-phosphate isomerase
MKDQFQKYVKSLTTILSEKDWAEVEILAESILEVWESSRQLFLCGNGGSAGNAIHLANDFLYGVANQIPGPGIKVEALAANPAVLTCLANDVGYSEIYAEQLLVKAVAGDLLIVLSGSGNSPNVIRALETGNAIGMKTFAILGYSGGRCRELAQVPIHFKIDDMQISEDLQVIVGHMCMQWLSSKVKNKSSKTVG